MQNNTRPYQGGFSLIELAIVLVILGILIGGVLKGRDLIETARLNRLIAQVSEYQVGFNTFVDKYEGLPGDCDQASLLIRPDLINGNGNGTVEGAGLATGSEALAFWDHLAEAGLITPPGNPEDKHRGEFGKGAPTSPLGGGFTVEQNPKGLSGLWLILGQKNGDHGDGALLTPAQAFSLDKKMDNGSPLSGNVRAFDGRDMAPHSCVTPSGFYNLANRDPACALFFRF